MDKTKEEIGEEFIALLDSLKKYLDDAHEHVLNEIKVFHQRICVDPSEECETVFVKTSLEYITGLAGFQAVPVAVIQDPFFTKPFSSN